MVWSNWQGAIWRGALAVVFLWTGLAWTQTPTPRPAGDAADRIMVVHENGTSKRCRVLESWQLPDGKLAHLLQSLESGEMVTIVDEQSPAIGGANKGPMAKRIFAWGQGKRTPPAGSPVPPQLRQDSGIVLHNESVPPLGAVPTEGPVIVNRVVDDKAVGGSTRTDGTINTSEKPATIAKAQHITITSLPDNKQDKQVIEFPKPLSETQLKTLPAPPTTPMITAPTPRTIADEPKPVAMPVQSVAMNCESNCEPHGLIQRPIFPRVGPIFQRGSHDTCTTCQPGSHIVTHTMPVTTTVIEGNARPIETSRRAWRPGDVLFGWLRKPTTTMDESIMMAHATKSMEKRDAVKAPVSTAITPSAQMTPPEVKKPEPAPLAISNSQTTKVDDKPTTLPAPNDIAKTEPKKVDMFGYGTSEPIAPGKSLLDPIGIKPETSKLPPAPIARPIDPLTMPERLMPKATVGTPIATDHQRIPLPMQRMPTAAEMGHPQGWPLGTQSVAAAKSGMYGPITYVPVPTVTVPQPNHPPVPPPPQMPDAPQLNAHVNAFSQPPAPKAPMATGPTAMPQWMQPNPAMIAQQQMMQQQMMQQQMMMQQMLAQGYRPNPMTMPPSTGPMSNMARHYTGPMPPSATGVQPASLQPMPPQATVTQQVEQLIKVLRESPYPAQREWAAQTLTSFEWRVHPQIVPALLQSASQDPAASVRAGCVHCLGRMGAAVEPVLGTLHSLRNDIDPRVRHEVEQAFTRLSQTPTAPQQ